MCGRACAPGSCVAVPARAIGRQEAAAGTPPREPMRPVFDPRRLSRLTTLSRATSVLVAFEGGVVLLGWELDIAPLTSVLPGRVAMNPVTALAFILAAGALGLSQPAAPIRRAARGAAGLVALIGLVTVAGYAVG